MCGIAGIVSNQSDARVEPEVVRRMCKTIVHRGPDDEGVYTNGPVGLGMRRLSIIDIAGGKQPVHNEDRTVWLVFNGEIYNFQELRADLESSGHSFYTKTDSEVIVHLYEEYGSDCVDKMRGMFSFAIYDETRKRLLLARDRLGIKPLYYALRGGRLLFGSEIKALLAAAPELADVGNSGLLFYFQYGYIPDPYSAFSHIRKLPPGHVLEFSRKGLEVREYWDLPAYGTMDGISEEECLEELERRLTDAVRMRLISDVPLGALLSGGVDSSVVVALMARLSSGPVKTFSIGFAQDDFNEAHHAREVAERFSTDHHELILEPDFKETLEQLTTGLEEPFGDSSILPTYFVSCMARRHVTVALSGDGGDELFAGYDRYRVNLRRRMFDAIPGWMGKVYRRQVYPRLPTFVRGRKFSFNISLPSHDRYLDGLSFLHDDIRGETILSADFLASANGDVSPTAWFRQYLEKAHTDDLLGQLLYLDTKTYLPADILTKVDRMSMATSLEVRVPILDHLVVEWATCLPSHMKLRRNSQKYILKRLAERLGIPSTVLHRRKQGFAIPLSHWFRKELRDEMVGILLEPRTMQRGYFDKGAVHRLVKEHLTRKRDRSGQIWHLLMLELWHRRFLEN